MANKKPDTQTNFRSAVDGKFVKESFAIRHPRETVKETGPKLPSPPPKKGR
jgi:hypothetical protein